MKENKARTYKKRERTPKLKFGGKRTVKQRVWDYMRRNPVFKPRDILTILDVNYNTLLGYIYPLTVAGFLQKKTNKRNFLDSTYVFIAKENVIHCPLINSKEVYCYTTKVSVDIGARHILMGALKYMSQGDIANKTGLSKTTINLLVHNKYPNPANAYKTIREKL